jgi:hypothetical protein
MNTCGLLAKVGAHHLSGSDLCRRYGMDFGYFVLIVVGMAVLSALGDIKHSAQSGTGKKDWPQNFLGRATWDSQYSSLFLLWPF